MLSPISLSRSFTTSVQNDEQPNAREIEQICGPKELSFSEREFDEKQALALATELEKNSTLEVLKLSDCRIPANSIETLALAIKKISTLKVLELVSAFNTPDFTLPFLVKVLENQVSLEKLVLTHQAFSENDNDDEFQELATVLNQNSVLNNLKVVELYICSNISSARKAKLIEVIGNIPNLEVLKFRDFRSSDEQGHVEMLANILSRNLTIKVVEFDYRPTISDECATVFVQALANIPTLEEVTLYCGDGLGNDAISPAKVEIVANAFEHSRNLRELKLWNAHVPLKSTLALFNNNSIIKLGLNTFHVSENEKTLLIEVLEKNTTLLSLKLLCWDGCSSLSEWKDRCMRYLERNKQLLFAYYLTLKGLERDDMDRVTAALPREIVQLIYRHMFDANLKYLHQSAKSEEIAESLFQNSSNHDDCNGLSF